MRGLVCLRHKAREGGLLGKLFEITADHVFYFMCQINNWDSRVVDFTSKDEGVL